MKRYTDRFLITRFWCTIFFMILLSVIRTTLPMGAHILRVDQLLTKKYYNTDTMTPEEFLNWVDDYKKAFAQIPASVERTRGFQYRADDIIRNKKIVFLDNLNHLGSNHYTSSLHALRDLGAFAELDTYYISAANILMSRAHASNDGKVMAAKLRWYLNNQFVKAGIAFSQAMKAADDSLSRVIGSVTITTPVSVQDIQKIGSLKTVPYIVHESVSEIKVPEVKKPSEEPVIRPPIKAPEEEARERRAERDKRIAEINQALAKAESLKKVGPDVDKTTTADKELDRAQKALDSFMSLLSTDEKQDASIRAQITDIQERIESIKKIEKPSTPVIPVKTAEQEMQERQEKRNVHIAAINQALEKAENLKKMGPGFDTTTTADKELDRAQKELNSFLGLLSAMEKQSIAIIDQVDDIKQEIVRIKKIERPSTPVTPVKIPEEKEREPIVKKPEIQEPSKPTEEESIKMREQQEHEAREKEKQRLAMQQQLFEQINTHVAQAEKMAMPGSLFNKAESESELQQAQTIYNNLVKNYISEREKVMPDVSERLEDLKAVFARIKKMHQEAGTGMSDAQVGYIIEDTRAQVTRLVDEIKSAKYNGKPDQKIRSELSKALETFDKKLNPYLTEARVRDARKEFVADIGRADALVPKSAIIQELENYAKQLKPVQFSPESVANAQRTLEQFKVAYHDPKNDPYLNPADSKKYDTLIQKYEQDIAKNKNALEQIVLEEEDLEKEIKEPAKAVQGPENRRDLVNTINNLEVATKKKVSVEGARMVEDLVKSIKSGIMAQFATESERAQFINKPLGSGKLLADVFGQALDYVERTVSHYISEADGTFTLSKNRPKYYDQAKESIKIYTGIMAMIVTLTPQVTDRRSDTVEELLMRLQIVAQDRQLKE